MLRKFAHKIPLQRVPGLPQPGALWAVHEKLLQSAHAPLGAQRGPAALALRGRLATQLRAGRSLGGRALHSSRSSAPRRRSSPPDGTVREPDRFAKMLPPSGLPLSLGREQYAQSSRTPRPGTAGTNSRKLRGRPARIAPGLPFSVSMLSYWSVAGLVLFFFLNRRPETSRLAFGRRNLGDRPTSMNHKIFNSSRREESPEVIEGGASRRGSECAAQDRARGRGRIRPSREPVAKSALAQARATVSSPGRPLYHARPAAGVFLAACAEAP